MITLFKGISDLISRIRFGRALISLVLVAAGISVYHYADASSSSTSTFVALLCLGLAGIGFHWHGAGKVVQAWHERRATAMVFWSVVVIAAIAWEGRSQLGLASTNLDSVKATRVAGWQHQEDARTSLAFAQSKAGAERKALEALRAREQAASSLSINGKPVTGPDVAQAEVDRLKGQKRFWDLTKGCTEAPGKQTREYCDNYRGALAAKATAENLLTIKEEVKRQEAVVAEADSVLARAGQAASITPAVVSAERADITTIKRVLSLSTADAELSNSLLLWIVTFVLLTIGGGLEKAEEYAGKASPAWINWRRIADALRYLITGKRGPEIPAGTRIVERTTIIDPKGAAFAAAAKG